MANLSRPGILNLLHNVLSMSCFKRKQRSADNIQVHPAGSSARKPRLEAPSLQDGSSSGGTPTDSDNKTDLPNPTDEELAKAVASVEEERRLVVETRALLCLEQERRRNVSEQLAAANLSLGKARESYEHAQERLAEEQKQRRKVDEKLRTLNVLRKSDRQEKNELEADRDRYKSIVQDMMSKRLLAGGTNIQAAFPTLLELQKDIRRALTMSVSEWIEDSTSVLNLGITPQHLLPQLFHACQNVVESYHGDIKAFFMGGPGADREGCDKADDIMDESTASDMRQHMRRHYRRLFPIEGIPFQKAFCGITSRLAGVDAGTEDRARRLAVSGLENIVQVYLPIMVGVLLQHPTVRFAGNCGMETAFCPKIHADSLDGDDVAAGDKCIIVFPALMREVEEAEGHQPLTHAYILPLPGA